MRTAIRVALAVSFFVAPSVSQAQTSIDGFGALSTSQITSFGETGMPFDFGGRVSFDVGSAVQLIGEFGQLQNVLPAAYSIPLSFVPGNVRVSAFYGEGGVRLLAAPGSPVTPYVEGTAGVAHLQLRLDGLGPTADALARAALNFVDSRDPVIGGGGGLLMRAGALQFDLGYRYKRILPDSVIGNVLSVGQNLTAHQMRFGMGVRF